MCDDEIQNKLIPKTFDIDLQNTIASSKLTDELEANLDKSKDHNIQAILQELRLHRVELEMQNEELKRSRNDLETSRIQFYNLFNKAPIGYLVLDSDGIIQKVNDTFCALINVPYQDVYQKPFIEFIGKEDRDYFSARFRAFFKNPSGKHIEVKIVKKDGTILHSRMDGAILETEKMTGTEKVLQLLLMVNDISDRVTAENTLRESEKRFRELVDNAPNAILVIQNGIYVFANPTCERMLGYSNKNLTGKDALSIVETSYHPVLQERITNINNTAFNRPIEIKLLKNDGSSIITELISVPIEYLSRPAILIIGTDITERRLVENNLNRTQKLESLGLLAGGIAHDFNNLLSGIFGYIELAKELIDSGDANSGTQSLNRALQVFDRARSLTKQLLTFSKGGAPSRKVLSINKMLKDTVEFALSGSSVQLKISIPENLYFSNFDPEQIGQVIDNIVINAKQAMLQGGTLSVSAENVSLSENNIIGLPKGEYVLIHFNDTGTGIPQNIILKIFDPFFSTKSMGSGLGLTTSYSIMKRHNGAIEVSSVEGQGSHFILYLPASEKPPEITDKVQIQNQLYTERALIVDDEDYILDIASQALTRLGFNVTTAKNSSAAYQIYQRALDLQQHFKLVILDLTIPGSPGGKEIMQQLKSMHSNAVFIVSSGYSDDPVMANPQQHGFATSIAKPFKFDELKEILTIFFNNNPKPE
jgi:PAS domain S-box-containing protein